MTFTFHPLDLRHHRKLMKRWLHVLGWIGITLITHQIQAQVPSKALQLITAKADTWSSFRASLQCWERDHPKAPWKPVYPNAKPVLLGKKGLAWGTADFKIPASSIPKKIEKDWKAPAGIFALGKLHGYAKQGPSGSTWPYHQVGEWDAWIDDPTLPEYNRHIVVNPANPPSWFPKQRMRLGDFAYTWLLEIQHNTHPPVPGLGSAIFFHVRRGPDRPSAGCTTMKQSDLEDMIRWLNWDKSPHYVLLPKETYQQLQKEWKLP